ncbi:MAG: thiamine-phosphate synthase family protein [Methanoregula sp.]
MISPDQQRNEAINRLSRAVILLEESMDSRLVAAGAGSNIGYALSGARDNQGVVAVFGGLVVKDNKVRAAGTCGFGADAHIARIILTALKFDPDMRCAATIRYTDSVLDVLEGMFLECCTIDRQRQSPGISTMDWGVASCCREGVPQMIVDPGTTKETAVIHLFGENPAVVTGNIIMLSNRIIHIEI